VISGLVGFVEWAGFPSGYRVKGFNFCNHILIGFVGCALAHQETGYKWCVDLAPKGLYFVVFRRVRPFRTVPSSMFLRQAQVPALEAIIA